MIDTSRSFSEYTALSRTLVRGKDDSAGIDPEVFGLGAVVVEDVVVIQNFPMRGALIAGGNI